MHTPELDPQTSWGGEEHDVANVGFVRPPFVYLAAILAGVGLDILWPQRWLPAEFGVSIGVLLVIVSLVLFVAATVAPEAAWDSLAQALLAHDTPVPSRPCDVSNSPPSSPTRVSFTPTQWVSITPAPT